MATKPHPKDSHPICPTCQSDLTGKESLKRLASTADSPLTNDDVLAWRKETETLVYFLGALAQAGPWAVAHSMEEVHSAPDWLSDFVRLAEELTKEAERRLFLLGRASHIWKERAEGQEG